MWKLRELIGLLNSRVTVRLLRSVEAEMLQEALRSDPKETGGVLLGEWEGDRCSVLAQVGPGSKSKHRLFSFVPDYTFQENEVARLYHLSGRSLQYVGDWHTHPHKELYLSRRDRETIKTISTFKGARCPRPIMVVLGGPADWQCAGWVGDWSPAGTIFKIRPAKVEIFSNHPGDAGETLHRA